MSKHILHAIPLLMFVGTALAAEARNASPAGDASTLAAQQLQEVVIEAPKVVRKADMDLYYPSESAVENSKNGVQLLRNVMIPTVNVNEVLSQITSGGESVQLRINGREATIEQVKSLLPETVKRVEWIDNPGLRYNGANTVLNFVVVNPSLGGSYMFDGMQALNCAWGNDYTALKLNNGRSQWGASMSYKLTNRLKTHREYSETFTFANGESLTRNESPRDGYTSSNIGGMQLDYSYVKPDTTVVWVALRGFAKLNNDKLYDGVMTQSSGDNDIHLRDFTHKSGFIPSLQAYFEQHFAHNQTIAVDFNATFYKGRTSRTYTEHDNVTSALLNDVYTSIKDHNQAYGVEANYIKKWTNSRLTTGVSYNANRNRSTYENLAGEVYHQRQDKLYFFGEYFRKINKVSLTAGVGAQYINFKFRETAQGNNSWNIRPQFSATYQYNGISQYSLDLATWQTAPSLAQTNIAVQQTDGIQWLIGNPNLSASSSYMLTLRYKYASKRVNGVFSIRAYDSPNAITPYLYWHDDRLVTSYENGSGLKSLTFTLSPQIDLIPNWVSISGSLSYRVEQTKGIGYRHNNHNMNGDITATATHWGFSLLAQYIKSPKTLFGEEYDWGETVSTLVLSYDWKAWSFGLGMLCPFNKYDVGNQSL
jgi:hypothetical protein